MFRLVRYGTGTLAGVQSGTATVHPCFAAMLMIAFDEFEKDEEVMAVSIEKSTSEYV